VGGAGASRDRRQTGNLESLGFTRISRGLAGFSLGFAVCFFLDSLVRIVTFQGVMDVQRRETFFRGPYLYQNLSNVVNPQLFSMGGRVSIRGALMTPIVADVLVSSKRLLEWACDSANRP
jgi:hypothetical protein